MPWEWYLSRVCEEGLASSVLDAMRQPVATTLRIMELRAYARTKEAIEQAEDDSQLPQGPMAELVWQNIRRAMTEG